MECISFYLIGGAAIVSAILMLTHKKPVNAAMSLIVTMLCLAGVYVLLDAHLIAALQIIVYAGAIMVLFLFIIMLLNVQEKEGRLSTHKLILQFSGIVAVGFLLIGVVRSMGKGLASKSIALADGFGTTKAVASLLFTDFILPFEIASVLLLAAMVGAVTLAKQKVD
jgi:NADH-quinone oxidoreductase subunit J